MERTTGIATRLADHPTSAISDALDDLGIAGAFSGIRAMREGIGRVGGRALPDREGERRGHRAGPGGDRDLVVGTGGGDR